MNLKKVLILEILFFSILLLSTFQILEIFPSLMSTNEDIKVKPYSDRTILKNTLTIKESEFVNVPFLYHTYDPAIIVLTINTEECIKSGYITLLCNYRKITSIYMDQDIAEITLILFSFSGSDWVEPPTSMFGLNELLFKSDNINGFTGELSYTITYRGSR